MRYNHEEMLPYSAFKPVGKSMKLYGKDSAPPPPDYSAIAKAQSDAAKYAYDAATNDLNFRKQVYQDNLPRQNQLYDLATQVANKQMGIMDQNQQIATDNNNYYKSAFKPMEQQTIMDAMGSNYLNAADQQQLADIINGSSNLTGTARTMAINQLAHKAQEGAANQAMQGAQAQSNSAYTQQAQNLARMGMDPSRLASAAAGLAQNQTLANINASNQARTNAYNQQAGLRTGVANFGRNMPNTAGQAFGLANTSGNNAVGNANTGFQSGLPYAQFQSGAYGNQINAANSASQGAIGMGGLLNQGYNTQMNGYMNSGSMLGGLLGAGTSLLGASNNSILGSYLGASDRSVKQNIELVGTLDSGINVYLFEYKPEYRDTWGHGVQLGVMADEVEKVIPEAVHLHEDGYKVVDYGKVH